MEDLQKMKVITFSDEGYLIDQNGKVWSNLSKRFLNSSQNFSINLRNRVGIRIDGKWKSITTSRLVYFFHTYNPIILKKTNPTLQDFRNMPMIAHKKDISDDRLNNLLLQVARNKIKDYTILKVSIKKATGRPPGRSPGRKPTICGDEAKWLIQQLTLRIPYSQISKTINKSNMTIYRFAKEHGFVSSKKSGIPKLTKANKQYILKNKDNYTYKTMAEQFGVSGSCISKFLERGSYKNKTKNY